MRRTYNGEKKMKKLLSLCLKEVTNLKEKLFDAYNCGWDPLEYKNFGILNGKNLCMNSKQQNSLFIITLLTFFIRNFNHILEKKIFLCVHAIWLTIENIKMKYLILMHAKSLNMLSCNFQVFLS